MTLPKFIEQNRIKIECRYTGENPAMRPAENEPQSEKDWYRSANHWKVTLRMGGKRMTVSFSQGCAHSAEPSAADVLSCLISDAGSVESAGGFEEWARDLGYDTDSRRAERTFKACERQTERLRSFLGDLYEQALYKVESY